MVITQKGIPVIVIETIGSDNIEWGISLTDSNPKDEDYFKMPDKETAFRLKERLAIYAPISLNDPFGWPSDKFGRVEV